MKIVVSTHQGMIYNEEVEYVVIRSEEGEFAIMNNHLPIISVINQGYIKLVQQEKEIFIAIVSGMLEFHDNEVTVLAQEAQSGNDLDSARKALEEFHKNRLEQNRIQQADFTKMEKDLQNFLKNAKAGSL